MRLPTWLKLPLGKFGDPYGQSADRRALIEIDLDKKMSAEHASDDEPSGTEKPDDEDR